MGNCQAAEAATVVIQHPDGRLERVYWSVSASHVMAANPGHYVAVIITSRPPSSATSSAAAAGGATKKVSSSTSNGPVKHLKLLRPDDTLHIGHVYRLVSFEEVLREFASKKHVKLSRLLVAHNNHREKSRSKRSGRTAVKPAESSPAAVAVAVAAAASSEEAEDEELESIARRRSGSGARPGQWRPALQSISECGT